MCNGQATWPRQEESDLVREYVLASTPEEAVRLVADDRNAIVIGGGTTIVPRAALGELSGRRAIGLARAGLDYVRRNGELRLGAMTSLQEVAELDDVPALAEAARSIGGWALRTTATIGGNLLVDRPYGDLAPILLALDAEVVVAGADGERRVPLAAALGGEAPRAGELLTEVVVSKAFGRMSFQRCARLAAGAPPIVSVAARVRREGDMISEARIAMSAVGPRPYRATGAEEALVGSAGDRAALDAAIDEAAGTIEAADDAVASAWYRERMARLHLERALLGALDGGDA
jgi:CO/xanthine dehydrogenase FAD-binding subunit